MITNAEITMLERAYDKAKAECDGAIAELESVERGISFARHQLSLPANESKPQQEFYGDYLEREESKLPQARRDVEHAKRAIEQVKSDLLAARKEYFESLGLVVREDVYK